MKKQFLAVAIAAVAVCNASAQSTYYRMLLFGTVYDQYQMPVPGAKITFIENGSAATSGNNGRFKMFRPLSTGIIVITASGYKTKRLKAAVNMPQVLKIYLEKETDTASTLSKKLPV